MRAGSVVGYSLVPVQVLGLMYENILLLLIGSAVFFWLGALLERARIASFLKISAWILGLVLAVPGLLLILYYIHLFDNAAWFYNLRVLPYTELSGCGLGFLAGMVHSWWQPESLGEKLAVPAVLLAMVLVPFVKPLLNPLDITKLKDHCDGAVCMQSTFSTCGPASAATLLRSFGHSGSERDLAAESLTTRGGTEIWYLARALNRRGMHSIIQIQSRQDPTIPIPSIAGVLLPGHTGHFIAILSANETQVVIADPMKGKFVLNRNELAHSYQLTGFFLVLHPPTRT